MKRWHWPQTAPSSAEVKGRVELYLFSPSGLYTSPLFYDLVCSWKGVNLRLPPSSVEVKGRVWLPLLPLWAFMAGYGVKVTIYYHHVTCTVFSFDSLLWTAINIYEHVKGRQGNELTSAANDRVHHRKRRIFITLTMRPFAGRRLADSFCCACPNCICSASVDIPRWRNALCNVFLQSLVFQQPLLGAVSRATRRPTSDVIYLEFLVQAVTKVKP